MIMAVFISIFPLALPLPFLGLGLFVSCLQAFVFLLLSSVYIAEVEDIIAHHNHAHGMTMMKKNRMRQELRLLRIKHRISLSKDFGYR